MQKNFPGQGHSTDSCVKAVDVLRLLRHLKILQFKGAVKLFNLYRLKIFLGIHYEDSTDANFFRSLEIQCILRFVQFVDFFGFGTLKHS
jgi:hypothetical protein